jgi:hypothetical protein
MPCAVACCIKPSWFWDEGRGLDFLREVLLASGRRNADREDREHRRMNVSDDDGGEHGLRRKLVMAWVWRMLATSIDTVRCSTVRCTAQGDEATTAGGRGLRGGERTGCCCRGALPQP